MSAGSLFDLLLCALLVVVALGAVLARDLTAVVMLFVVLGLFAAVAWVRLGALDVALAEASIGAGLTGVLLVRAAARLRGGLERGDGRGAGGGRPILVRRLVAAGLCAAVFVALAHVVLGPLGAAGLAGAVDDRLAATGVSHPVTAVLLNFRGYDTLLETVVLLAALLGAWSLCADEDWGGRPGWQEHARPQGQMAWFARMLPPVGWLVGVHLLWAGASGPGGAFQAGTVLAAVWLLLAMAGLDAAPPVTDARLRAVLLAGPLLFLGFAAAAIPFGGFLVFPPAAAKLAVLAIEAALTLSIAATLALLVMGAPRRRA